jgi:iron(III) transport system substrate-binding protein
VAEFNDSTSRQARENGFLPSTDRRSFFRMVGGGAAIFLGAGGLAACGSASSGKSNSGSAAASPSSGIDTAPADMNKARQEGLVLWHDNTESLKVEFLKGFTAATGIKFSEEVVAPETAVTTFQQEYQAGKSPSADVYDSGDVTSMYTLQQQGYLVGYSSSEMTEYSSPYVSTPKGYYTVYRSIPLAITYRSDHLPVSEAPKTYEDLLDPKWKGKIGVQTTNGATAFAWWYELRNLLPSDYFDQLAKNAPRVYSSVTAVSTDLDSGAILIGAQFAISSTFTALMAGKPYKLVLPATGTPTNTQASGILAKAAHPNAAKAYTDYLLSQKGQQSWTNIIGSYSPRSDVTSPKGLPSLKSIKPLATASADPAAAAASSVTMQYTTAWNAVTGLS